jgi:hypothetical protein
MEANIVGRAVFDGVILEHEVAGEGEPEYKCPWFAGRSARVECRAR